MEEDSHAPPSRGDETPERVDDFSSGPRGHGVVVEVVDVDERSSVEKKKAGLF